MIFKIEYYEIQSDHFLAVPEYYSEEYVNADLKIDVIQYIMSAKKDTYYNSYRHEESFGFDLISAKGAVKIKEIEVKSL